MPLAANARESSEKRVERKREITFQRPPRILFGRLFQIQHVCACVHTCTRTRTTVWAHPGEAGRVGVSGEAAGAPPRPGPGPSSRLVPLHTLPRPQASIAVTAITSHAQLAWPRTSGRMGRSQPQHSRGTRAASRCRDYTAPHLTSPSTGQGPRPADGTLPTRTAPPTFFENIIFDFSIFNTPFSKRITIYRFLLSLGVSVVCCLSLL